MATITLVYRIDVGNQDPANFVGVVEAIDVDADLEPLNMTVLSDDTVQGAPGVIRTIVLQTNATSDAMFPTDANKIAATRGLLTNVFGIQVPAKVTADEPVVS